jgi:hypothetical protein
MNITKKLLNEIKDKDYKDKKELIEEIETFKAIYKKTGNQTAKEIVNGLTAELEELNNRIDRIRTVTNGL